MPAPPNMRRRLSSDMGASASSSHCLIPSGFTTIKGSVLRLEAMVPNLPSAPFRREVGGARRLMFSAPQLPLASAAPSLQLANPTRSSGPGLV